MTTSVKEREMTTYYINGRSPKSDIAKPNKITIVSNARNGATVILNTTAAKTTTTASKIFRASF